jgi:hypothetical protein
MRGEQETHVEPVDPGLEKSFLKIIKFLTAVQDNKSTGGLCVFNPEKPEAPRQHLKLSDNGDLQIKQGKNWLLVTELPPKLKARLRLDPESLNNLQTFLTEKAKEKPYRSPIRTGERAESAPASPEFVVSNAVNPFREAGLASGIPDIENSALVQEKENISVDLVKILKNDQKSYRSGNLTTWAYDISKVDWSKLTPDKQKIIEKEIKDGALPVFTPGAAAQLFTTLEEYTKRLKPLYIKEGQPQKVWDAEWWGYFLKLIENHASELFVDVPDRPYLLLQKLTQRPEPRTCDKTVAQQLQEFAKIQKERREAFRVPASIINPVEYGASQKRFTEQLSNIFDEYNYVPIELNPLDSESWTRFPNLPLSPHGDVPGGFFNPKKDRLFWHGNEATEKGSECGFRYGVRVEL